MKIFIVNRVNFTINNEKAHGVWNSVAASKLRGIKIKPSVKPTGAIGTVYSRPMVKCTNLCCRTRPNESSGGCHTQDIVSGKEQLNIPLRTENLNISYEIEYKI
jgi:hypothetical protein